MTPLPPATKGFVISPIMREDEIYPISGDVTPESQNNDSSLKVGLFVGYWFV
jgi:hypothetical protein